MNREWVKVPSLSRSGVCILRWSVPSGFPNLEYGIRLLSIYLDAHLRGVRMEFSHKESSELDNNGLKRLLSDG